MRAEWTRRPSRGAAVTGFGPAGSRVGLVAAALALLGLSACSGLKPPTLQLEALGVEKLRISGVSLDVKFHVRNPNPEPMRVERFEYELKVNGQRLGRGYYPDSFELTGFGDHKVESTLDVNFLSVPAGVREVLERDRVKAEIRGDFYVLREGGLKKLGFKSDAEVRLKK